MTERLSLDLSLDLGLGGNDLRPGPSAAPAVPPERHGTLWVHATTQQLPQLTGTNLPVVYTAASNTGGPGVFRALEATVSAHRSAGGAPDVSFDANRYAGTNRTFGASALQPGWLQAQDDLGLPILNLDSGYVENGDWDGVERLLAAGAAGGQRFGDRVHTDIAVDSRMVRHHAERFVDLFTQYKCRVTLKLAHRNDPLAHADTVAGLVQILQLGERVGLGRTDLAGLGALALGAGHVSIGTGTSLRHVFPPVKKQSGPPRVVDFAVLIPQALQFRGQSRVLEVIALAPDDPRWMCLCSRCAGRSIEVIRSEQQAWEHGLDVIFDRAEQIASLPTRTDRIRHWSETCAWADFVNRELRDDMPGWPVPEQHGAWKSVLDKLLNDTRP